MRACVEREYDLARAVVMHSPGSAFRFGALAPSAALFEHAASPSGAKAEHRGFVAQLERFGVDVLLLKDIFSRNDSPHLRKAMSDLASGQVLIDGTSLPSNLVSQIATDMADVQRVYTVVDWFEALLDRQHIALTGSGVDSPAFDSTRIIRPQMDIAFTRDQQIVTDRGVVMGRFRYEERALEPKVTELAFRALGVEPIHHITNGYLEGGDFIAVGDTPEGLTAFIGQGARTNADGIADLLGSGALGYSAVAVVKDPVPGQQEMHLDTFFGVVAQQKAIIRRGRVKNPEIEPRVDLYRHSENGYVCDESDIPLSNFLSGLGFDLLELPKSCQKLYGLNFLTVEPNHIIGVDIADKALHPRFDDVEVRNAGMEYLVQLQSFGVQATLLPFTNLNGGFGGPHCLTQVFNRSAHMTNKVLPLEFQDDDGPTTYDN